VYENDKKDCVISRCKRFSASQELKNDAIFHVHKLCQIEMAIFSQYAVFKKHTVANWERLKPANISDHVLQFETNRRTM